MKEVEPMSEEKDKDALLWEARQHMTEEEIKAVMEQEERELQELMMTVERPATASNVEVFEEDEDDVVSILPDGTIVSEAKEKEEEEISGIGVQDPSILLFGVMTKLKVMKEMLDELYEAEHVISEQGLTNEWLRRDADKTLADIDGKTKMLRESIRLMTGFSDDAEDMIERGSKRIEDKDLELVVVRRMMSKFKDLLDLTD